MPSLFEHAGGEDAINSNAETGEELHPLREAPRWTWDGDDE